MAALLNLLANLGCSIVSVMGTLSLFLIPLILILILGKHRRHLEAEAND